MGIFVTCVACAHECVVVKMSHTCQCVVVRMSHKCECFVEKIFHTGECFVVKMSNTCVTWLSRIAERIRVGRNRSILHARRPRQAQGSGSAMLTPKKVSTDVAAFVKGAFLFFEGALCLPCESNVEDQEGCDMYGGTYACTGMHFIECVSVRVDMSCPDGFLQSGGTEKDWTLKRKTNRLSYWACCALCPS